VSGLAFRHGVASGDPLPDAVVLWTRVSDARGEVDVRWRVARDEALRDVVAQGTTRATPDGDWTVRTDVRDLEASATYWYGFTAGGVDSPIGRTRTAPTGATARLRLGVTSCASWPAGYFTAYAGLAARDLDAVVHLGDYIYEHTASPQGRAPLRRHDPEGAVRDLAGYRARHAQYRSDADLQTLHAAHPVIAIWDDHDFAGDAWRDGAAAHDDARHGPWPLRRDAAARAYREWLPLRLPDPGEPLRIYRRLTFGDLADLVLLDTRVIGREEPPARGARPVATVPRRDRSLLGDAQRAWLRAELGGSTARWRLLGNQVMLSPLRALDVPGALEPLLRPLGLVAGGIGVNPGQWDSYPGERAALLEFLRAGAIGNVVVLTGDLHSSWAAEVTLDPRDDGAAPAVEFVTPAVTSDSFAATVFPSVPRAVPLFERLIRWMNPHVRYLDTTAHGYLTVDVVPERLQVDYWHVDRRRRDARERWGGGWVVPAGEPRLLAASSPAR
jgi:alkaline phosphatase D